MAKALSKPSFNDFNFKPNFSMHEIKLLVNYRTLRFDHSIKNGNQFLNEPFEISLKLDNLPHF